MRSLKDGSTQYTARQLASDLDTANTTIATQRAMIVELVGALEGASTDLREFIDEGRLAKVLLFKIKNKLDAAAARAKAAKEAV